MKRHFGVSFLMRAYHQRQMCRVAPCVPVRLRVLRLNTDHHQSEMIGGFLMRRKRGEPDGKREI